MATFRLPAEGSRPKCPLQVGDRNIRAHLQVSRVHQRPPAAGCPVVGRASVRQPHWVVAKPHTGSNRAFLSRRWSDSIGCLTRYGQHRPRRRSDGEMTTEQSRGPLA